jgi:phosphoribosylpyrophosphate synthetase
MNSNKTIVSFAHFENMGREIAEKNDITFANLEFNRFGDGWPQLKLPNWKEQIEHKDVTIMIDASNPAYTFANYALIR